MLVVEYGWEPGFYTQGGGHTRGGMPWVTFRGWLRLREKRVLAEMARSANERMRRQREQRGATGG